MIYNIVGRTYYVVIYTIKQYHRYNLAYKIVGGTYDVVVTDLRYRSLSILLIHIAYDIVGPYTPTTLYVMTYDIIGHKEIISYTIS